MLFQPPPPALVSCPVFSALDLIPFCIPRPILVSPFVVRLSLSLYTQQYNSTTTTNTRLTVTYQPTAPTYPTDEEVKVT